MISAWRLEGTESFIVYDSKFEVAVRPMKGSKQSVFSGFQAEVMAELLKGKEGTEIDGSVNWKMLPTQDDEKKYMELAELDEEKAVKLFIQAKGES